MLGSSFLGALGRGKITVQDVVVEGTLAGNSAFSTGGNYPPGKSPRETMQGDARRRAVLLFAVRTTVAMLAMLLVAMVLASSARATTLTVTNHNNSGPGSLRQAIADAASGDTINVSVSGTISLTSGELLINKNLTVAGPGARALSVSGNNGSRVFNVAPEVTAEISGLTVTRGRVTASGTAQGGGVLNAGTLTLRAVAVSGNTAIGSTGTNGSVGAAGASSTGNPGGSGTQGGTGGNAEGGGVANTGTLILQDSTVSANTANGGAGGQGGNGGSGANGAGAGGNGGPGGSGGSGGSGKGGGVFDSGSLTVTNSTLDSNIALGSRGGNGGNGGSGGSGFFGSNGRYGDGGAGGNGGNGEGGGAHDPNGNAVVTNATVTSNTAQSGDPGSGGSGSSFGQSGSFGASRGGGIFSSSGTAIGNTIVALNTASSGGSNIFGSFADQGSNLVDTADPKLDSLQNYGGPTDTRALLQGSAAIDAVTTSCPPPQTDQRGVTRPKDGDANGTAACDIGAFELQLASVSVDDTTVTEGDAGTTSATFTVTRTAGDGALGGSVGYATADGTATAGSDYTAKSGTLDFASGETSQTITVDVQGDTLDEDDETFSVVLSNASGATISDGTGTGTITEDDDQVPTVSVITSKQRNASITVKFTEEMDKATLMDNSIDPTKLSTSKTIKLFKGTTEVPAKVRCTDTSCNTVVLDPDKKLAAANTYTVRIEGGDNDDLAGVADLGGNELAQDFSKLYKTGKR